LEQRFATIQNCNTLSQISKFQDSYLYIPPVIMHETAKCPSICYTDKDYTQFVIMVGMRII